MYFLFYTLAYFLSLPASFSISSEEERIIGIEGAVLSIRYFKKDYSSASGKIQRHTYYVRIQLDAGNKMVAYEDLSYRKVVITQLDSLYQNSKEKLLIFETTSGFPSHLNVYNDYKAGNKVIIKTSYWSVNDFLKKKIDNII